MHSVQCTVVVSPAATDLEKLKIKVFERESERKIFSKNFPFKGRELGSAQCKVKSEKLWLKGRVRGREGGALT